MGTDRRAASGLRVQSPARVESAQPESGACLFLLADPRTAGSEQDTNRHVLEAAAARGVALEGCADITILRHPLAGGDESRLHAAVDAYVQLGPAGEGHARLAEQAGCCVLEPTAESIAGWLAAAV